MELEQLRFCFAHRGAERVSAFDLVNRQVC